MNLQDAKAKAQALKNKFPSLNILVTQCYFWGSTPSNSFKVLTECYYYFVGDMIKNQDGTKEKVIEII